MTAASDAFTNTLSNGTIYVCDDKPRYRLNCSRLLHNNGTKSMSGKSDQEDDRTWHWLNGSQ